MRDLPGVKSPCVRSVRWRRPFEFVSPFDGAPHFALLLAKEPTITADEQERLSQQLVESGCRYAVCAGHDCSSWDDSIDMVSVLEEVDLGFERPLVMTTWHADEALADVVAFLFEGARLEDVPSPNYLLAVVGGADEDLQELETLALRHLEARAPRRDGGSV